MAAIEEGESKENISDYWVERGEKFWDDSDKTTKAALEALTYMDKAININPLNYKAWADKGFFLKQMGEYDSALMCLNRSIGINRVYIPPLYNKAVLLGLLGRFEEAVECYNQVLELDPNNDLAKRDLAMLQKVLGNKNGA